MALKSLLCLVERHPTYHKTIPSKVKFFSHWLQLTEAQRLNEIKDERLYQVVVDEVKNLGCPASLKDLEAIAEGILKQDRNQIENVTEYIKLSQNFFKDPQPEKFEQLTIQALSEDKDR